MLPRHDGKRRDSDRLVQTFTNDRDHSYLSDAQYVAVMRSLIDWIERGEKPSAASVAARCKTLDAIFDPTKPSE